MTIRSRLYAGHVFHHRLRPRVHKLRHGVFWMLLDLDEIGSIAGQLKLFSHNRFNIVSFHDADHGDGSSVALRIQIGELLRTAGMSSEFGRIELLCMPRIFGYGFNPLSVYFCYRSDESLAVIIYEVHNTFGERHNYIIPCKQIAERTVEQRCAKAFFVSPFLEMDMSYSFLVDLPAETVKVSIRAEDGHGPILFASLFGSKQVLSDKSLLRLIIRHPALTVMVVAAIHWHALRMVLKGFRLRRHEPVPPRVAKAIPGTDMS